MTPSVAVLTSVINIHLRRSPRIFEKFKTAPTEYLGAWGTLIHEKNLMSKISCQTPFKIRKLGLAANCVKKVQGVYQNERKRTNRGV